MSPRMCELCLSPLMCKFLLSSNVWGVYVSPLMYECPITSHMWVVSWVPGSSPFVVLQKKKGTTPLTNEKGSEKLRESGCVIRIKRRTNNHLTAKKNIGVYNGAHMLKIPSTQNDWNPSLWNSSESYFYKCWSHHEMEPIVHNKINAYYEECRCQISPIELSLNNLLTNLAVYSQCWLCLTSYRSQSSRRKFHGVYFSILEYIFPFSIKEG